ncbi:MAG: cupin domain-containing protein [Candidatus Paceibacterota bacterium]
MNGYVANIEKESLENENFRTVLYTDERLQLVVMNLKPNEDIGEEVHALDQFIRVEKGEGKSVLDGEARALADGFAVIIPAGTRHNIVNTSSVNPLKLYTLYAPPNHKRGTVHKTKADALADEGEHFKSAPQEFD